MVNEKNWLDQQILSLEADHAALTPTNSAGYIIEQIGAGTWIYGAGNYGRQIAAALDARNLPCLGFIDQRGEDVGRGDGLPIIRPEAFSPAMAAGKTCLIGVFNPQTWGPHILPYASAVGFKEVFWGADLLEAFGSEADSFWLTSRRDIRHRIEDLRTAAYRLSDQKSRDILFGLLKFRLSGDPRLHPEIDLADQYLPADLPGFEGPITFVDGGAFDGDTYRFLVQSGVTVGHWIAFEPDRSNFGSLASNAREANATCTLFPCGLSDHSHQVTFHSGMGAGSRMFPAAHGPAIVTTINCVALDDVIQGQKVDYVKCDIEGGEHQALKGMARTLGNSRPRVALSLYHKPYDLWDLINQTAGLLPDTDFYIRQHSGNSFETVMYAIPRPHSKQ